MKSFPYFLVLPVCLLAVGCASVDVVKVPVGSEGDKVHGFRYYMPRPCVAVRKPFPVVGWDYFAYGTIQDGNVVSIDLTKEPMKSHRTELGLPYGQATATLPLGTASDEIETQAKPAPGSTPGTGTGTGTSTGTTTPPAPLTSANATLGDSSASPLVKVNDYFDIIEMPDFNQMYAVQTDAGVGKASTSLNLAGGWMLTKADVNLDNSELGKLISDSVSKLLSIAQGALLPGSSALTGPQTQAAAAPSSLPKGTTVLLRVRRYFEAQVGVYPFLKPDEVAAMKANPPPSYFFIQYGMYTVGYSVREVVDIEVVKAISTGTTPGGGTPGPGGGTPQDLTTGANGELNEVITWWKTNANDILDSSNIVSGTYDTGTVTLTVKGTADPSSIQTSANAKLGANKLFIDKGKTAVKTFVVKATP